VLTLAAKVIVSEPGRVRQFIAVEGNYLLLWSDMNNQTRATVITPSLIVLRKFTIASTDMTRIASNGDHFLLVDVTDQTTASARLLDLEGHVLRSTVVFSGLVVTGGIFGAYYNFYGQPVELRVRAIGAGGISEPTTVAVPGIGRRRAAGR